MSNVMQFIRELLSLSYHKGQKITGHITYLVEIDLSDDIEDRVFLFQIEREGSLYCDFAATADQWMPMLDDEVEFSWHATVPGMLVAKLIPEVVPAPKEEAAAAVPEVKREEPVAAPVI